MFLSLPIPEKVVFLIRTLYESYLGSVWFRRMSSTVPEEGTTWSRVSTAKIGQRGQLFTPLTNWRGWWLILTGVSRRLRIWAAKKFSRSPHGLNRPKWSKIYFAARFRGQPICQKIHKNMLINTLLPSATATHCISRFLPFCQTLNWKLRFWPFLGCQKWG